MDAGVTNFGLGGITHFVAVLAHISGHLVQAALHMVSFEVPQEFPAMTLGASS